MISMRRSKKVSGATGNEVRSVCDILGRVEELAAGRAEIDGEMLVRSFGSRSYGLLLLLFALLEISR